MKWFNNIHKNFNDHNIHLKHIFVGRAGEIELAKEAILGKDDEDGELLGGFIHRSYWLKGFLTLPENGNSPLLS